MSEDGIMDTREFLLNERCDRCNAPALREVYRERLNLLFCNHHYRAHESALAEQGWSVITDQSIAEPVPVPA